MNAAHTPGPWTTRQHYERGNDHIAIDAKVKDIAHVYSTEADARLIAAAPTMLLALETALRHAREAMPADQRKEFDDGFRGPSWMFAARDAIAKATGK